MPQLWDRKRFFRKKLFNKCVFNPQIKMKKYLLYIAFLFAAVSMNAATDSLAVKTGRPDSLAIKTNLLWDATMTPNLALEYTTGRRQSVQISYGFNKWKLSGNKRLQNWIVMPEYRWWRKQAMKGLFFGAHAFGGEYNIGGIKFPFGIWKSEQTHRYNGWLVGAGGTVGYAWKLGGHWNMEAALGLGYAYLDYDKYKCEVCGEKQYHKTRHYVGPTKLALNISYVFGTHRKPRTYLGVPYLNNDRDLHIIHDTIIKEIHDTLYIDRGITSAPKNVAQTIRQIRGVADIKFVVNKTTINDTYMANKRELQALADTLGVLARNPEIISMYVRIKGTASPESPYQHNAMLAKGRAEAVVERLKHLVHLPEKCELTSTFEPENWEGLIQYVKNDKTLSEAHRADILRIITRTDDDPDLREANLRGAYPKEYRHLLHDCYPALRMTLYEVEIVYREKTDK